jgi:hypothetical protein
MSPFLTSIGSTSKTRSAIEWNCLNRLNKELAAAVTSRSNAFRAPAPTVLSLMARRKPGEPHSGGRVRLSWDALKQHELSHAPAKA